MIFARYWRRTRTTKDNGRCTVKVNKFYVIWSLMKSHLKDTTSSYIWIQIEAYGINVIDESPVNKIKIVCYVLWSEIVSRISANSANVFFVLTDTSLLAGSSCMLWLTGVSSFAHLSWLFLLTCQDPFLPGCLGYFTDTSVRRTASTVLSGGVCSPYIMIYFPLHSNVFYKSISKCKFIFICISINSSREL